MTYYANYLIFLLALQPLRCHWIRSSLFEAARSISARFRPRWMARLGDIFVALALIGEKGYCR